MAYQLLYTVSFIFFLLFIVFLLISIILFWKWSIIKVYQELTGRSAQKSMASMYQSILQKEHAVFYRTNILNLQSVNSEQDVTEKIITPNCQEIQDTDVLHGTVVLSHVIHSNTIGISSDNSSQQLKDEQTTILKTNTDNMQTTLLQNDVATTEKMIFEEIVHIVLTDTKEFL